jgi:hypothetical protein
MLVSTDKRSEHDYEMIRYCVGIDLASASGCGSHRPRAVVDRKIPCRSGQGVAKENRTMIRKTIVAVALGLSLTLGIAGSALGAANPSGTGQPNQSCEDQSMRPGNASSAPGSAFNPDGNAGTHYAGEQPQNSNNPKSVSQYDTACFQVSTNH